jgi:hypothetical protein
MIGVGAIMLVLAYFAITDRGDPKVAADRKARHAYEDACHVQVTETGKFCPPYQPNK